MKKSYILILLVIISVLFGTKVIYNNSAKAIIKDYYKILDTSKDISKYNKLVIEDKKLDTFKSIPDIVKSRDILELKKLNANEYPILKKELNYRYLDYKENIRYYMIKYDIKFKENVTTPVDSGTYYEVISVIKHKNKWLITGHMHKASFINGKLIIEN